MEILNCSLDDLESVQKLHEAAREYQKKKNKVVWPVFENELLKEDILEKRLWKLMADDEIACTWAITYADKEIWGELDKNNSIYLHRIATNPKMRGKRFIDHIVEWSKSYASSLGRRYVRLDTLGYNAGLIKHYTSAGFTYLGITRLTEVKNLPEHYHREPDCLRFEMKVDH
jgi:GNAT superfamily N-acetyltransferase